MCTGSVHVAHRMATDKERLVSRIIRGHGGLAGFYPVRGTKNAKLVCIRRPTKVVVSKFLLKPEIRQHFEGDRKQQWILKMHGKENVSCVFDGWWFSFGNRKDFKKMMHLTYLETGMKLSIGHPVPKPKIAGMVVIEGALREVMATEPKPGEPEKPAHTPPGQDPERDKPGNPTPGQKPEEHPGKGEPTPHPRPQPAARRRRKVTA